ncbi:MAG TPA: site-2 protease family protein, partial [Candidatus Dormibacteraeota bacterium]|nr:site-2 protease family protein [Candidatus Dormibacteraeota bacterium]
MAGIGIYMHFTFLLLLAWVGTSAFFERHEVVDAVSGILFVLILFMIVVWHELGHALTARHFGIRTLDITLLPIGGVARLERMPDRPAQEFLMAIAGPAVNGALALICFMVLFARQRLGYAENLELLGSGLVSKLFQVNVALTVFNLLPA